MNEENWRAAIYMIGLLFIVGFILWSCSDVRERESICDDWAAEQGIKPSEVNINDQFGCCYINKSSTQCWTIAKIKEAKR